MLTLINKYVSIVLFQYTPNDKYTFLNHEKD